MPAVGDTAVVMAPPWMTSDSSSGSCVELNGDDGMASRVVVRRRSDGVGTRLRVSGDARLVVSGSTTSVYSEMDCLYPTPAPTLSMSPTSPTEHPTHLPSVAPTITSQTPTNAPTLSPSYEVHECGGAARWSGSEASCTEWDDVSSWSTDELPDIGDTALVSTPPWLDSAACVAVADEARVSRLVVRKNSDGTSVSVLVSGDGRISVSGQATSTTIPDTECLYPTPVPSITRQPTRPTLLPTHIPTGIPTSRPNIPSHSPSMPPSPPPTLERYVHTCGAVVTAVSDDEMTCGALKTIEMLEAH